jgi:hypothetical protein
MFASLERLRGEGGDGADASSASSREPHAAATAAAGAVWGLARLDALRTTLQSSLGAVAQGVGAVAGGATGRSRSESEEPPQLVSGSDGASPAASIFRYFRQGGLDSASSPLHARSSFSPRSPSSALAATAARAALSEERYADVRLPERVQMRFDTVAGRIVLISVEQGAWQVEAG